MTNVHYPCRQCARMCDGHKHLSSVLSSHNVRLNGGLNQEVVRLALRQLFDASARQSSQHVQMQQQVQVV
jgi:hypothetical protein